MKLIEGPVKFDPMGICINDNTGNKLLDVRGWGKWQYIKDGAAMQDSIGYYVAEAINEKLTADDKPCQPPEPPPGRPVKIFGNYWQCPDCRKWQMGISHQCNGDEH